MYMYLCMQVLRFSYLASEELSCLRIYSMSGYCHTPSTALWFTIFKLAILSHKTERVPLVLLFAFCICFQEPKKN